MAMTHDELLVDIESKFGLDSIYGGSEEIKNALRAVVELHKPDNYNECFGCDSEYPCKTIQAIEKELG